MSSQPLVQTNVAKVFEACALEVELVCECLANFESAILGGLLDASRVSGSASLQAALQDLDGMAQHLRALHAVLAGAAAHEAESGHIPIREAVARVTLTAVAARMANVMSLEGVAETPDQHDEFELL
jgi:hypothetical protein